MNRLHILKGKFRPSLRSSFAPLQKAGYSSSRDENQNGNAGSDAPQKKEKSSKTTEAADRLNKLLLQMANDKASGKLSLDLAKPIPKRKRPEVAQEVSKEVAFEERLKSAAKEVAQTVGSDEKRVESELISKLLDAASKDSKEVAANLSSIMKGMKIERDSKSTEQLSRAQQVKQLLEMAKRREVRTRSAPARSERRGKPRETQGNIQKVDIFDAEPLGLFRKDLQDEGITNEKWRALHEKELQLAVTHPPANYFQQMIQWTESGKIWKFPIDNEQGMEEEQNVYFTEHVFLEKHLEPWCPPKGPIRHFMELVCVGLSKNSYMTVETKKEHIEWYRNYFEDKKQLLKEIGAIPAKTTTEATPQISDK